MTLLPEAKYHLRERIDKEGKQEIYIRVFLHGKCIKKATGYKVLAQDWDPKKEQIKGTSPEIYQKNTFLKSFRNKVNVGIASYQGELSPLVIQNILNNQPADRHTKAHKTNLVEYIRKYNQMLYNTGSQTYKTYINKESCIQI